MSTTISILESGNEGIDPRTMVHPGPFRDAIYSLVTSERDYLANQPREISGNFLRLYDGNQQTSDQNTRSFASEILFKETPINIQRFGAQITAAFMNPDSDGKFANSFPIVPTQGEDGNTIEIEARPLFFSYDNVSIFEFSKKYPTEFGNLMKYLILNYSQNPINTFFNHLEDTHKTLLESAVQFWKDQKFNKLLEQLKNNSGNPLDKTLALGDVLSADINKQLPGILSRSGLDGFIGEVTFILNANSNAELPFRDTAVKITLQIDNSLKITVNPIIPTEYANVIKQSINAILENPELQAQLDEIKRGFHEHVIPIISQFEAEESSKSSDDPHAAPPEPPVPERPRVNVNPYGAPPEPSVPEQPRVIVESPVAEPPEASISATPFNLTQTSDMPIILWDYNPNNPESAQLRRNIPIFNIIEQYREFLNNERTKEDFPDFLMNGESFIHVSRNHFFSTEEIYNITKFFPLHFLLRQLETGYFPLVNTDAGPKPIVSLIQSKLKEKHPDEEHELYRILILFGLSKSQIQFNPLGGLTLTLDDVITSQQRGIQNSNPTQLIRQFQALKQYEDLKLESSGGEIPIKKILEVETAKHLIDEGYFGPVSILTNNEFREFIARQTQQSPRLTPPGIIIVVDEDNTRVLATHYSPLFPEYGSVANKALDFVASRLVSHTHRVTAPLEFPIPDVTDVNPFLFRVQNPPLRRPSIALDLLPQAPPENDLQIRHPAEIIPDDFQFPELPGHFYPHGRASQFLGRTQELPPPLRGRINHQLNEFRFLGDQLTLEFPPNPDNPQNPNPPEGGCNVM